MELAATQDITCNDNVFAVTNCFFFDSPNIEKKLKTHVYMIIGCDHSQFSEKFLREIGNSPLELVYVISCSEAARQSTVLLAMIQSLSRQSVFRDLTECCLSLIEVLWNNMG